jgi:TRAP-type C4-dicarboxylate transport system permease small subunit
MRAFVAICRRVSGWMNGIAGIVLLVMMMLTVVDVVLRSLGRAITGTYELVAIAGAIVVGFAVAQTSWDKAHIFVDFLIEKRTDATKKLFLTGTRVLGIAIFALLAWNLFLKAIHLQKSGEVSMTLHIPYYPLAYALAFCFLAECFVLVADVIREFTMENDHE